MNTDIIIGIVIAVVVILALIVVGIVLARRRRISLTDQPDSQVTDGSKPQVDRSGGYQAGSGFSFSQGGAGTATAPPPAPGPTPTVEPVLPSQERTETDGQPAVGDDASIPRDSVKRGISEVSLPDATDDGAPAAADSAPDVVDSAPDVTDSAPADTDSALDTEAAAPADASGATQAPAREEIAPTAGRLGRLRGRLSRSQGAIGKSMLGLLGAGDLDEDSWEEIEDTLVMADLGTASTTAVVERLRTDLATNPVRTADDARALLKRVLVDQLHPEMDRSVRALPHADKPAVILVVGVNGTGKTTTTGKLARVLVADGRRVLLGAADTFRAAAADQLQTWGERVGADIVRGKEQADPASVAFDAVAKGIDSGVDVVMIDTAGRLHTKTGLMDELGKVKRVVEKKAPVDEVLLVLDATVGQNGLTQARVFAEVVDITGVVLTKLDGTAKGGIVFHVQEELGVPVKLVGLGEGADDLAPFEPEAFVDALL
ncbi:signal recognition particle receptor [Gordonia polyisoprenivorans NBRC 16320 = JCM 10675]|uniref:Signal recognition particle receptor FtsY n=1 Tax=Gordonia polyisoprenivorans TaxID=84595 RepID=A0A846WN00_9ACTN|nr:signal recognition particle-docking protein FtsY [Gordonia polyisoprenivorans]NKY02627.1 signal recognition particle-docking protein FtsY [Gordonia polyisoprenivorans]QUD80856.1 signal recognition particle-docking protein FtsY [Gordonia polyisoprenivorans]GAB24608.1 signal recognition particle receptor [Gordonia polyisoprenivorans NBRC 16320 = JCM 10675]